ncbi:MAG: dihydroorotate dehydrogenase electron transfer subunit [Candidatus Methanofastidiosa archaeon]|nr:dihydroorotate dehydrogenase electron transfer subunit [Candidatus Methanofastidiosa archaeon]
MIDLEVIGTRKETKDTTTLFFDKSLDAVPGQFGMFWLAGKGQKPMSFSYHDAITVKDVGPFTHNLSNLCIGDRLSAEAPLGKGFDIKGNDIVLIGGGFGVAPLRFLAQRCHERGMSVTSLLGYRKLDEVLFDEELRKYGDVYVATEDGSCGEKGLVTCLLNAVGLEFDQGYCCGPERMLVAISRHIADSFPLQFSLERYMKCGLGLCGSCEIDGLLVCKDGPVFNSYELGSSFGSEKRDKSGRKTPI